jgi:catalase
MHAAKQRKSYQFDDSARRLKNGKPLKYRLLAQLAENGDPTGDSTNVWPTTNGFAEAGKIAVESLWSTEEGDGRGQKTISMILYPGILRGLVLARIRC